MAAAAVTEARRARAGGGRQPSRGYFYSAAMPLCLHASFLPVSRRLGQRRRSRIEPSDRPPHTSHLPPQPRKEGGREKGGGGRTRVLLFRAPAARPLALSQKPFRAARLPVSSRRGPRPFITHRAFPCGTEESRSTPRRLREGTLPNYRCAAPRLPPLASPVTMDILPVSPPLPPALGEGRSCSRGAHMPPLQ